MFCIHNIDMPLCSSVVLSPQSTLRFLSQVRWVANHRLSAGLLLDSDQWTNYTALPLDTVSEFEFDLTRLEKSLEGPY